MLPLTPANNWTATIMYVPAFPTSARDNSLIEKFLDAGFAEGLIFNLINGQRRGLLRRIRLILHA
jgi:hypothetical protein